MFSSTPSHKPVAQSFQIVLILIIKKQQVHGRSTTVVCCFTDTTLPENEHSEVVENSTSIFICHDFTSSAASWRLVQKRLSFMLDMTLKERAQ